MASKTLATQCVKAAADLFERWPWHRTMGRAPFAIRIDGHDEEAIGMLLDARDGDRGLAILVGPSARSHLRDMLIHPGPPEDLEDGQVLLLVARVDREEVRHDSLRLIEEANWKARQVPLFLAIPPEGEARTPRNAELRLALQVLRGLVQAPDPLLYERAQTGEHEYPELGLSGKPNRPKADVRRLWLPLGEALPPIGSIEELASLPQLDYCCDLGMEAGPQGGPNRYMIALDATSGERLAMFSLGGRQAENAETVLLMLLFAGNRVAERGRPKAMRIREAELFEALAPRLEGAGIACTHEPELPGITDGIEAAFAEIVEAAEMDAGDREPVFDDAELQGWKERDFELSRRIGKACGTKAPRSDEAQELYFGEAGVLGGRPADPWQEMRWMAYCEWYAHRFRVRANRATASEQMIGQPMAPDLRELMRARSGAVTSLYEVVGVERGQWIRLLDLFHDDEVLVHDQGLSSTAESGQGLVLRVYPAGPFHFAAVAGPVILPERIDDTLDLLEEEFDLVEPLAAEDDALFGRLWEARQLQTRDLSQLRLTNTDGHELRGHELCFEVLDATALHRALDDHPVIRRCAAEEGVTKLDWDWVQDKDSDSTLYGRLQQLGDELLVEVNSQERMLTVRGMLEAMPGLRYRSLREFSIDPRQPDTRPLDDRLPEPEMEVSDELKTAVQEFFTKRCMAWLDESIPMLGGKSPREVARDPSRRAEVAALIRGYADPGGMGVEVPRQAMLRELGLD